MLCWESAYTCMYYRAEHQKISTYLNKHLHLYKCFIFSVETQSTMYPLREIGMLYQPLTTLHTKDVDSTIDEVLDSYNHFSCRLVVLRNMRAS